MASKGNDPLGGLWVNGITGRMLRTDIFVSWLFRKSIAADFSYVNFSHRPYFAFKPATMMKIWINVVSACLVLSCGYDSLVSLLGVTVWDFVSKDTVQHCQCYIAYPAWLSFLHVPICSLISETFLQTKNMYVHYTTIVLRDDTSCANF